ncbi:MAG: sulfotransferase domain-containing protein [Microcystaceae cyanobacterium]
MPDSLASSQKINKFCIVTTQRSGSSWLVKLLGSHPDIVSHPELFNDSETKLNLLRNSEPDMLHYCMFREKHNYNQRPFITFQYFDYLEKKISVNHCQAMGFKVMYDQIGLKPEILINIVIRRYKIVHLMRNNYLDIIISRANAWGKEGTKVGNKVVFTTKPVDLKPIELDCSKLIEEMAKLEHESRKYQFLLKYIPNKVININYESLLNNRESVLEELCSFLEVKCLGSELQSSLQKISSKSNQEKIMNYTEVKKTLENTKYSVFLEDS